MVPAGITKYRDGLFPIGLFTAGEAGEVIDMIESRQQGYFEEYGLHFIHASDEWYITAGREFPEEERYDGYIQLENGVGMMRLFINEFNEAFEALLGSPEYETLAETLDRTLTIATGKLTTPHHPRLRRAAHARLSRACTSMSMTSATISSGKPLPYPGWSQART